MESEVDWFFEHVAYGHLDEMPDRIIRPCLIDHHFLFLATGICIAANSIESCDDPMTLYEYMKTLEAKRLDPGYKLMHGWLLIESLRRKGYTKIPEDMLIRECVHKPHHGIQDALSKPFRGHVMLTQTGEVVLKAN
jgi:hypothetical protein